jgi:hypothetical protein
LNLGSHISNIKKSICRGHQPDDATTQDRQRLLDELHIASVIDLRSRWVLFGRCRLPMDLFTLNFHRTEHIMAANKRLASLPVREEGARTMTLTTADEYLLDLPGLRRIMVDLTGWNFQKALLWRLSWLNLMCDSFFIFIFYFFLFRTFAPPKYR